MSTRARRGSSKSTSSKNSAASPVDVPSGQDRMRAMNRQDRMKLTQGKLIAIVDSQGTKLMDFPLALFNAITIDQELVVNNEVTIPANINIEQAKRFLFLMMKALPITPLSIFTTIPPPEYLGMGSFTQKIFDMYFKRVNQKVPAVVNIEAIGAVRMPPGDKIFKQMAYNIAVQYFKDKIPNREGFEKYLATNERLHAAVSETVARKEIASKRQRQHEMSMIAFAERQRKREEKARLAEERAEQANGVQSHKKLQRKNSDERKQQEIVVRQSMLEKKRTGQKMSFEEARAHEKVFGKAVPY